jgi:hypothetical protein
MELGLAVFREPSSLGLPDTLADANGKLIGQVSDLVKVIKSTP